MATIIVLSLSYVFTWLGGYLIAKGVFMRKIQYYRHLANPWAQELTEQSEAIVDRNKYRYIGLILNDDNIRLIQSDLDKRVKKIHPLHGISVELHETSKMKIWLTIKGFKHDN